MLADLSVEHREVQTDFCGPQGRMLADLSLGIKCSISSMRNTGLQEDFDTRIPLISSFFYALLIQRFGLNCAGNVLIVLL